MRNHKLNANMAAIPQLVLCLLCILSERTHPACASRLGEQQQTVLKVCGKGLFLSEQNLCLPCNCKGHADYCEDITGVCISCKDHSTGDFCEMCEDGYVLSHRQDGRHICQPCACPLSISSNNFAVHCDRATLRCKCQEGYAGHRCERCAPGYYGNPLLIGSFCKRCDCNGNTDPNLIFNECHNMTGHCQHCWGNTAGANCERCAPGFHGDAIGAKNCRECECNPCGTSSCDDRTGVCHCRPGVTGPLCNQCEEGYSGFSSCHGCRRCECGPASIRSTCHPLTHSCPCRPGAGGRYCERCLPGFWDYSPSGCKKCDCESGHCDMQTGECLAEAMVNMCNNSCDDCTWKLIEDLKLSNKTLDKLKVGVLNISTGAAANDRLKYYNYTAHQLQRQFQSWQNKSSVMKSQTEELEEATDAVVLDIKELRESESLVKSLGNRLDEETDETLTLAEQLSTNLTDLNLRIEDMIHDWELYSVHQEVDPEVVRQNAETAQKIVTWMRQLDLSPREPIATDESAEAHDLLRRIRQMEKKLLITEGRLPSVQQVLSRFSTRLSEAQDVLLKATSSVRETEDRNRASLLKFSRKEVKQQRMTEDHSAANRTLEAGRVFISDSERNVAAVDALVKNVTQYHAEIDGASQKLMEKTERLQLVDRELVQRSNDHSVELERQADELEEDLRESDANGFVQRAISAANVYNNIVKYAEDANITSLTTFNLSQRAEDAVSGINTQLEYLVKLSQQVFKESVSLHSQQNEVGIEVVDKLKYIEETKETMDTNQKKLEEIVHDIDGIQTAFTDRTQQRLNFTLEVAEGTLRRSSEVLQTITPISSKVEEWANNMRNNEYSTAAYERAVASAGEAVENLNVLVPELLDKLMVVEDKKPINNVTTNIMRVRELISQARSVVRKVQVSMKFNGQSSVEVHPHGNLEELKTVTSISLFIRVDPDKDPIEDRFILYLGDRNSRKDYMGLAIKNDNLVFVYNLGSEDVEIPLTSKPVSQWPAVFNHIKIERLGRHGKVFLTIPSQGSTDEQKFIQKGEAPGSLFDVDPKNIVFYVGGAPPGVKLPPPLSLAPFVGCIELSSLNNGIISLYNFKETHNMNVDVSPPCSRYKLAFSESRVASYLFDGRGYALINNMERRAPFAIVTRFDIAIRTVTKNGAIFLMVNGDKFFLLELKNGFLNLMYDFGFNGGPKHFQDDSPNRQINDARYHEVTVIYHHSKKVILVVDKNLVKTFENPRTTLPFSDIYIGGAPSSILTARPELSSVVGLKGCVKGFQFQKKDFNLLEEPGTIDISSGCPEESFMSREAYFNGHSVLGSTAKISPFDSFEGGLNFRTLQPSGLLFYHSDGSNEFSISLENGAVVLNNRGTKVKSHKKQYSDGRTHFIVASVNNQKYSLIVDDKDKQEKKRPFSATASSTDSPVKTFYYGGSLSSSFKNFTGCISYAYINRQDQDIEAEDFQKYTEKVDVYLQECPVQHPPAALLSRQRDNTPRAKPSHSQKVTRDKPSLPLDPQESHGDDKVASEPHIEACYLSSSPRSTRQAFHYGGVANSRHHYTDLPDSFPERFNLSLSMKTQSSFGLIFYASDVLENNFITAFLSHGKLVFTFNIKEKKVKIRTEETFNNGAWHNVFFIRDGSMGRLLINGLTGLVDRTHGNDVHWQVSDSLFIGGVPPGRAQKNIQRNSAYSFTGCLKNLQLDGQKLSSVAETFGVGPCFEGPSEAGTYFSEEGGYVVLDESFELGLRFELVVEVRPRVASGVLLHVRSANGYFIIYIHHGVVIVLVNDGRHEFFTKVSPRQSVCDGAWHRITVIRNANVVQLNVDSEISHVVGPVNASPTDTRKPVFIGGAPDLFLPDSMATRRPYVGCMKNLIINRSQASFSKAVLVSGAVSVGTCPSA